MTKTILLVCPPNLGDEEDEKFYKSREHSLLCLGSVLVNNGFDVEIIPSFYTLEEIKKKIIGIFKNRKIGMVAVTTTTPDYPAAREILKITKENDSDTLTVIGGHHVTWLDKIVLKESPFIDVVVRGEGERTILQLAKTKNKNEFHKIKGITYRNGLEIARNKDRPLMRDFERISLDLLDRYLKEIKKRCKNIKIFVEASRGCAFNCLYCEEHDFFGHKIRYKNIEWLLEEFDTILNNFHSPLIYFSDSTFTFNKPFIKKLTNKMIKRKYENNFEFHTRVDRYDKEIANILKKASFDEVYFGIEHLHPMVLKVIRKNFSFGDVISALKNAKSAGQDVLTSWVVGLPGDNYSRSSYSLSGAKLLLKKKLIDGTETTMFVPYPGTEPFNNPSKFGLKILTYDWSRYQRRGKPVIKYDNFSPIEILFMFKRFRRLPGKKD